MGKTFGCEFVRWGNYRNRGTGDTCPEHILKARPLPFRSLKWRFSLIISTT